MEEELQQAIQLRAQNNFLAVQTPSSQLRQQQEQGSSDLKNLQLKNISGLTNIGATCYMNSVLQTLFMTPEFRKNLYAWKFNDEEYVEQDCIPYQLQKLFAKMQTQFSDFIDTKELIKSFQWNEYQEFEQHDVQEFIKKLFNAIEDTMQGTEKSNFIKDLYQGVIQSYVKCSECGYESIKEQVYNDIIITVKNIFDKIYNESLEKGLQRYLKPEILEGDNAYQCSQCNKKVFGYDGIKNKLPEENIDPKYFDNDYIIKPTVKQINDKKNLATKPTQAKKIYEKKVNGRTQSTSDFIKKMRQQNKSNAKQQDFIILEKKNGNENINEPPKIINFSENGKQNNQNLQKNEQDDQNTQENKKIQQESKINAQLNQQSVKNQQLTKNINGQLKKEDNFQQQQQQEKQQQNEIQTNSMKQKILNDSNEIREKKQNDENNEKELSQEEKEKIRMQKIKEERIQFEKELLEAFNKKQEENEKLIEQYKKEGELVYELYSVLVHSGGAYGGHYYVLIKNFQDKQWYSFNDTRVTQFDLRKFADESQGGNNKNAYMLFYRQIEEDKEKEIRVFEDDIPDYIKQILAKDKEKLKQQVEMEKQKSQLITVRVYYKLDVKLITLSKKQKYNDLLQQALQIFKLEEINQQNARIRAYKPQQDLMQEVYTGKEEKTLEDLKIGHFKNICIEIKNDEEQFEDYDENQISLKICLWNDKYVDQSLEESNLDFKILKFQKNLSLQELILSLSEKLGLMKENLAISVQHLAHGQQITEEISNESNLKLSLDELNIYENSILYIEEKKEGKNLNWPEQFEVQQHKINIKFNTPKNQQQQQEQTENEEEDLKRQEFSNNLSIDSRLTVSDLKEQISKKLKIDKNQILMRRGGKQGQEIKEGKPGTLKSQHFFNGSSIYLEYGLPAKEGEVRLCISLAKQADLQNDNIFHEFQEIGEFPIQANLTAFQKSTHERLINY
ncbi:hypothetical protein PPERSA_08671 [Pseudocohnilembus persalinus]|uniref:Ubiquitin carboxyl-terminal hydrolase n=1 Tax=Pseudocohnilembus persalinus TaxID=266149 RepID=A0A0V0R861_PSEPJ|nr:hypothetical protein PPERSA_08671 [Pseudocohnilembus persalinus]|eukprot:KRX10676.1 hypothetical protein PPERSA_08671 [Pseudocohnilembus persalinus]